MFECRNRLEARDRRTPAQRCTTNGSVLSPSCRARCSQTTSLCAHPGLTSGATVPVGRGCRVQRHRQMRTRPPVTSCCGAMRRALPIPLRGVWCPPLSPVMMYRSRRAAKKARMTESLQKGNHDRFGSINGHNYEPCRTQKCLPLMGRRDLLYFRTRHMTLHQTQTRWAQRRIEDPLNRTQQICEIIRFAY